jgi:hypothetical protein
MIAPINVPYPRPRLTGTCRHGASSGAFLSVCVSGRDRIEDSALGLPLVRRRTWAGEQVAGIEGGASTP